MTAALAGLPERVKNYAAALRGVGIEPVISLDPEECARCDGLVLPGGGDVDPAFYGEENRGSRDIDRALDERQFAVLDTFLAARRPILGICRGLQLINIRLGGTLIQHLAVAEGHVWSDGDQIHRCLAAPGSVLEALYGREFPVNSQHHQALGAVGDGLRLTGWSPEGVAEAMEHDSLPILGVQFHPERMCFAKARPDTVDGAVIFRYFAGLLGKNPTP